MTINDHDARPNVPTPINSTARTALTALAMFFDERHAARLRLAEEMRTDEDPNYSEQRTMADAWLHAANAAWEIVGGRPDGSFTLCDHMVKISARELGKLIGMATREPLTQAQPSAGALTFDDGLVEWLADVYSRAHDATKHGEDFAKNGIRAILSELAAMSGEMPTEDEVMDLFFNPDAGESYESSVRRDRQNVRGTPRPHSRRKGCAICRVGKNTAANA